MKTLPSTLLVALFSLVLVLSLACAGGGDDVVDQQPAPESEAAAGSPAAGDAAPDTISEPVGEDVPPEALARARKAANELMGNLKAELVRAINEGGPAHAIPVCNHVAPEITGGLATEDLRIARTSMKTRNQDNAPDDFERRWLGALEAAHASGSMPDEIARVVDREGGRTLRYLKPIELAGPCVNCHGERENMDQAVLDKIDELYPQDEATGYEIGDFRGVVTVALDLES